MFLRTGNFQLLPGNSGKGGGGGVSFKVVNTNSFRLTLLFQGCNEQLKYA